MRISKMCAPRGVNYYSFAILSLTLPIPAINALAVAHAGNETTIPGRERISLNEGWKFSRSEKSPDNVVYDYRLDTKNSSEALKPWILPSGNDFIKNPLDRYQRPTKEPNSNVTFIGADFDDSAWSTVNLPHDWAIAGPFYSGDDAPVTGGMGRLPSQGVGWYRQRLTFAPEDQRKTVYLDIDGAMSYAMVWLNGKLVGGWPFGYNSFRLDLTPFLNIGGDNQLAIRLDNPVDSSRWYPGGGLYRNVWLTKVDPVHVAQWGTFITSREVSQDSAVIDAFIQVENRGNATKRVDIITEVHIFDTKSKKIGEKVASFATKSVNLSAGEKRAVNETTTISSPKLWGPLPQQKPNLYVAVTRIESQGKIIDTFEARFGIRSIDYDPEKGLIVNGEHIRIQGVNQHHDLGALGAAFNYRAAERQLEVLHELGCNSLRMAHNPPAPELLDLADELGFIVMDEIFDMWERKKTDNDFHLIFPDWYEQDLRSVLRRDRNHPSIIIWSFGNEVSEQETGESGTAISRKLHDIVLEEDPTRPTTTSMNAAKPNTTFPGSVDIISLNYQGEGIRDAVDYSHLTGRRVSPQYPAFHAAFPEKMILSSESAAALSTRGTYIYPISEGISAPVNDTSGGNSMTLHVSSYELYSSDFGSSADKVFGSQDRNPYVAGEFVWSGWDYLGEPTPYYQTVDEDYAARSSYFGIIDLAGFPKDRFFLYQSRWRPDLKMAHILPHWTWPDRVGQVTPVHVFTSGDEAELFVNGESQGRKKKGEYEYRFRWDDVVYQPGELHVVTYKNGGAEWANSTMRTAGKATQLEIKADRTTINADEEDLSFVSVKALDADGNPVQFADNLITFSAEGAGEIMATDNGDPTDLNEFPSKQRNLFSGLALAIIRTRRGETGSITVTATGEDIKSAQVTI
ncbi:glycoside hydrolase family 2 sugar binding protein, partial [Corynespora cassiicola Philippines]